MFKRLFDTIRNRDANVDPVTAQMSQATQNNEVANATLQQTMRQVLDRPHEDKVGVLKLTVK